MNILDAFKASNCGKIRINADKCDEMILDRLFINFHVGLCLLFREDWEPIIEPLSFERIRENCVTGETLLTDQYGFNRLYLGFNRRGYLVTDHREGDGCSQYTQDQIKDWRIGGKWVRDEK